ncbi:MAG: diadenylate cyclase, partial [Acidimicrobiia bacterium]
AAIGTLLVYGLTVDERRAARIERRLPTPPPLNVTRPTDLAPLRHVLTQLDGAAVFDDAGTLVDLGARLVPSLEAEAAVAPLRGTRHTNARRFSHDHPGGVLIAVSDEGPVTVFRAGDVVGRSAAD